MQTHRHWKQVIVTKGEVTIVAVLAALLYSDLAKLICHDLFNNKYEFKFNFDKDSEKKIVPESLMWLQMISEGTNVSLLDDNKTRDIVVGLSQLAKFNNIKRKCEQSVLHVWQKNLQENPLTVYIGLYI